MMTGGLKLSRKLLYRVLTRQLDLTAADMRPTHGSEFRSRNGV